MKYLAQQEKYDQINHEIGIVIYVAFSLMIISNILSFQILSDILPMNKITKEDIEAQGCI